MSSGFLLWRITRGLLAYVGQDIHDNIVVCHDIWVRLLRLQEAGDVVVSRGNAALLWLTSTGGCRLGRTRYALHQTGQAKVDDMVKSVDRLGTVGVHAEEPCDPRHLANLEKNVNESSCPRREANKTYQAQIHHGELTDMDHVLDVGSRLHEAHLAAPCYLAE